MNTFDRSETSRGGGAGGEGHPRTAAGSSAATCVPGQGADFQSIGKIAGVSQRKLLGGYYTQEEVDEILALDTPWIVERLASAQRNMLGAKE